MRTILKLQRQTGIFAFFTAALIGCLPAQAQQMNQAWTFTQQNRASIAALMQQVEGQNSGSQASAAPASYTSLICGADGTASAKGNSTCIILNNATGAIDVGQDSQGNQSATDSKTESTAETSLGDAIANLDGSAH